MKTLWRSMVAVLLFAAVLAAGNYWLNPHLGQAENTVRAHTAAEQERAQAEPYRIGMDDLAKLEPFLWVDARSIEAFENGHAPRAALLNPEWFDDQLEGFFDRWRPEYAVVVYCDGSDCHASDEIAARLRRALGKSGGDRVYVLKDGWQAYLQSGRAVEQ